jgi:hypothetical protein
VSSNVNNEQNLDFRNLDEMNKSMLSGMSEKPGAGEALYAIQAVQN